MGYAFCPSVGRGSDTGGFAGREWWVEVKGFLDVEVNLVSSYWAKGKEELMTLFPGRIYVSITRCTTTSPGRPPQRQVRRSPQSNCQPMTPHLTLNPSPPLSKASLGLIPGFIHPVQNQPLRILTVILRACPVPIEK